MTRDRVRDAAPVGGPAEVRATRERTMQGKPSIDKERAADVPPCGCHIGDLLAVQGRCDLQESGADTGGRSEERPDSEKTPAGVANGDNPGKEK